jgi:hypothetical protein
MTLRSLVRSERSRAANHLGRCNCYFEPRDFFRQGRPWIATLRSLTHDRHAGVLADRVALGLNHQHEAERRQPQPSAGRLLKLGRARQAFYQRRLCRSACVAVVPSRNRSAQLRLEGDESNERHERNGASVACLASFLS